MAFGNKLGVTLHKTVSDSVLFAPGFGNIVAEVPNDRAEEILKTMQSAGLSDAVSQIGAVNDRQEFICGDMTISMEEALGAWTNTLERVFPTRAAEDTDVVNTGIYETDQIYVCKHKTAKPTVFIPVFPGTNCEYDSARAFEAAGANVITKVFKNLTAEDIRDSVKEFERAIAQSQMIMFPGGFSAGDEQIGRASCRERV